jgi:hypothetical protein
MFSVDPYSRSIYYITSISQRVHTSIENWEPRKGSYFVSSTTIVHLEAFMEC